jgi:hypothetical protein
MIMKFSKLSQLLVVSSLGLTLLACSNTPNMMTQAMPKSGFLPNYSLLEAVPNTPSGTRVWRYRNEAVNPNIYTAVIIEPIYLNQAPTQDISAESLIQAKIALQDSMRLAVLNKGTIKITTKPGPSVARISVGITGAEASADSLQPWNFTPIGLAANAAAYAAGVNAKTPALVVESKITDSQTNALLGEGLITIEGESFRTASGSVESFIVMAKKVVEAALQVSANPTPTRVTK